jgi:rhamnosyltransferase
MFNRILFISNSSIQKKDKILLENICDEFIIRNNLGYDFAAWRDGIKHIGWEKILVYDSVTLMNDSCFGPVYSIESLYNEMESRSADFWGITNHAKSIDGMPGTNLPIPPHIQSYLTVYNRKVIKSERFQNFWNNIVDYRKIENVIINYETQLTSILTDENFSSQVYFDTENYSNSHSITIHNYSELLPLILLRNKVPLLKIKSFKHTPRILIKLALRKTSYPFLLIDNHLKNMNIKTISILKFLTKKISILLMRPIRLIYNSLNEK